MKLLVVEDDRKVAGFIEQGLKEEGYVVDVASDGEEAGTLAHVYEYDVILLDVVLPRKNGLGLTSSRAASTSLCGFDTSFGAGLLEAIAQVAATNQPVLLVATDTPYPEPLHAKRFVRDNFGMALVLTPPGTSRGMALLHCSLRSAPHEVPATACRNVCLEGLRSSLPAAAGVALLEAIAQVAKVAQVAQVAPASDAQRVVLACPPALQLHVDVTSP